MITSVNPRELGLIDTISQCTQSRPLNRSFISCTALRVPGPPAHPLARSQFTSLGVKAAVHPIRIGRNRVLCMVYASTSMAYSPSCPPFLGTSSISSRPGSGGRAYARLSSHAFADAAIEETYSAPSRLTPAKATVMSMTDIAKYTPTVYHPYSFISILSRCESDCDSLASGG